MLPGRPVEYFLVLQNLTFFRMSSSNPFLPDNAPYTSSDPNQTYNTVSVHSSNEKETTPDSKKIDIRTVGGVPSIGPAFERLMSEVKDKQNVNRNISERILSNEFEPIASSQNINPQISLKSAVESGQSQRVGSVQHSHHFWGF